MVVAVAVARKIHHYHHCRDSSSLGHRMSRYTQVDGNKSKDDNLSWTMRMMACAPEPQLRCCQYNTSQCGLRQRRLPRSEHAVDKKVNIEWNDAMMPTHLC
jgi:hypothetical protein